MHDLYFEPKYEEFRQRTIWSLSNAFTSAFEELESDFSIPGDRQAGRVSGRVLTVILAISPADWGEAIGLNRARLATSNGRDGGGCLDHPWAVNVVHNLLDSLADHLHTNDRV